VYAVVATHGAAHSQVFEVECSIPKLKIQVLGSGASRRAAEQAAARGALDAAQAVVPAAGRRTRVRAEKPEKPERAEKPEKADKVERPDKPDKPEKAAKADTPEAPERATRGVRPSAAAVAEAQVAGSADEPDSEPAPARALPPAGLEEARPARAA